MKRLRCCNRWCYWRVPLGPWSCSRCERRFWPGPGVPDVPKAHIARFFAAIDDLIAQIPPLTAAERELLRLFR